jgi:hypothetical protein
MPSGIHTKYTYLNGPLINCTVGICQSATSGQENSYIKTSRVICKLAFSSTLYSTQITIALQRSDSLIRKQRTRISRIYGLAISRLPYLVNHRMSYHKNQIIIRKFSNLALAICVYNQSSK